MTAPADFYDTPLLPAEFDAGVREAIDELDGPEGEVVSEYLAWLLRRYPTPLARLAYARRKYAEARAVQRLVEERRALASR